MPAADCEAARAREKSAFKGRQSVQNAQMGILQSIAVKMARPAAAAVASSGAVTTVGIARSALRAPTTKSLGDGGEELALRFLIGKGLLLVARNFKTPGRGGGEVDLIMRCADGTLVFVEVRQRSTASHGGAAASISHAKRRRIIYAAQHFISRLSRTPPCRFDVIALQGVGAQLNSEMQIEWLQAAFDAS